MKYEIRPQIERSAAFLFMYTTLDAKGSCGILQASFFQCPKEGIMVHKSLLSIAVASMMLAGSLAATTPAFAYKALAMSDWGEWGFARHYPTPERARINAVSACERTAGEGACREISTWEGNDWYFVGVTCFYSSYTAASPQGFARAEYLAYNKADIAGDFDCWTAVKKY